MSDKKNKKSAAITDKEVPSNNGTVEFQGLITALQPLFQSVPHPDEEYKGLPQTMSMMSVVNGENGERVVKNNIPVISANAIRAILRTNIANDMLERVGGGKLDYLSLALLCTGGLLDIKDKKDKSDTKPGTGQAVCDRYDLVQKFKSDNMVLSLLGGGTGGLIVSGKTSVTPCIPIIDETVACIPFAVLKMADGYVIPSLDNIIGSSTRGVRREVIDNVEQARYLTMAGIEDGIERKQKTKDNKTSDEKSKRGSGMLYEIKGYIHPKTKLYNSIMIRNASNAEIGAIYSAFGRFVAGGAILGALSNRGFGHVSVDYILSKLYGDKLDRLTDVGGKISYDVYDYLNAYYEYLETVTAESITIPKELR